MELGIHEIRFAEIGASRFAFRQIGIFEVRFSRSERCSNKVGVFIIPPAFSRSAFSWSDLIGGFEQASTWA